jgi:hypothetical protein
MVSRSGWMILALVAALSVAACAKKSAEVSTSAASPAPAAAAPTAQAPAAASAAPAPASATGAAAPPAGGAGDTVADTTAKMAAAQWAIREDEIKHDADGQWAITAKASSTYNDAQGNASWSAQQATGEPNVEKYSDDGRAAAPAISCGKATIRRPASTT